MSDYSGGFVVGVLFTLALGGVTLAVVLWAAMTQPSERSEEVGGRESGSRASTTAG